MFSRTSDIRQNVFAQIYRATIPDKSLGRLAYFCSICLGNLSVHAPSPDLMLFIVLNSSLLVSNIVWGGGGRGVPIPVMSLLTVSKIIASQRIFILSDSGVPRTFVVDCSMETPCLCTSAVHQYGG